MQWILTGRLLWRASSNLRTLRRGCCSRPPNGLQSGWGMKSHNEELWDPLCCRQCRWLYQNKMQLYFFLFLSDSHLYFTDVCNIIFLCMRRVSSINPVKSTSFTFLLHWCSLSWDSNALTSMLLCEKNRGVSKKKKARQEQVQQFEKTCESLPPSSCS